jgi:uncharacterized protein YgbK (DUF1537 family)
MSSLHPYRIGILADDLTSAADGAGPFVDLGLSAGVGRGQLPDASAAIRAVDSQSRSASAADAAARATRLTGQLAACDILYKTCDSTLRGHVKIELEAAFAASGRKTLVFAPAFPDAGRTTIDGVQFVNGVPVAQSGYGRDPIHPVCHSRLTDFVPAAGEIVLLDSTTQAELDAKVAALPDPETILWVGSPGMAIALAKRFAFGAAQGPVEIAPCGDILIAIGSANPLSHRQADRVVAGAGVTLLRAPAERGDEPAAVLRRIAQDAVEWLRGSRFGTVIATGGDTMEAILDGLNVRTFEVLRELQPGFPLGRAKLSEDSDLLIAMKAGGFGDDDTLCRAVAQLRQITPASGQAV